jgi:hypothetical protein
VHHSDWFGLAMQALACSLLLSTASAQSLDQPHLSQAWTASSVGDGLQGQVGLEHYIYERDVNKTESGPLNGHVFDYGDSCKKIELDAGFHYPSKDFVSGTYYINCDAVDCCYGGDGVGSPPDVKKWDINKPGLLTKVNYLGLKDTTELNDKPVKQAEVWQEVHKLPLTKGVAIAYDYYITRDGSDITSHRIDFTYPGQSGNSTAGSILYGNFQNKMQDVIAHREMFKIPPQCQKNNLLKCEDKSIEKWERNYFRSNYALKHIVV